MKQLKAFKFQITPNGEQIRAMRQYAGNARKIWNLALHRQQENHAKVTKTHIDIGNARKDYLHKASHTISKNHAVVCIEELQIGNMSKSSKGHAEAP
jgi:transposase